MKYKLLESDEEWRPVKGFEGMYEVSNIGRVRSLYWSDKRIRSINPNTVTGYQYVTLNKEGKKKTVKVARLVAISFIENPLNKKQVNHKDFNRTNDNVNNLEWVTTSENIKHSFTRKRKAGGAKGEKHGMAKLTEKDIVKIRKAKKYYGYLDKLAKRFGIAKTYIWNIRNNKNWKNI